MRANQSQERLHKLQGATFLTLYRNLALPTSDPLILRVLSGLNISQTDIQGLEAKANGDLMRLSKDALLRMGQRYGVTFEQLLTMLRSMPESRQLLSLLGSPVMQLQARPQQLPPQDMERTHKYSFIVSCRIHQDRRIPSLWYEHPQAPPSDLVELRGHLHDLGYRTVLMVDPTRTEILTAIERLQCMLAQCADTVPHIFLLLDGHGTVIKSKENDASPTNYFLPSDARHGEPDTFLRVEEDLLRPLVSCLPRDTDEGLLVAVFDMCRTGSSVGCMVKQLCDKRIQRLYSTSYAQSATAYMNGRDRGTFGVDALNKHLKRLTEEKHQEDRLQPHNFLFDVSNLIKDMTSHLYNQFPDLQVSYSKASLSDAVFLSDKYAIDSANHIAPNPKLPAGNSSGGSAPIYQAADFLHPAWRKFALLIGAEKYKSKQLIDLPFVRSELRHAEGVLQLLGYQTVVCCDQPDGRAGLLEVVRQFCDIISKSAAGKNPVQVALIVDGHGELSVSAATEAEPSQASSLLLVPGAAEGGQQPESVDIEFDLARPLLEAAASNSGAEGLVFGFYDSCRSYSAAAGHGAGPTVADSVRTLDSPHYCRVFSTSPRRAAIAQRRSGSYGISALLECLREAACKDDPLEAARPIHLLPAVSDRIARKTHRDRPGETQFPSCNLTSCRISLAEVEAYRIGDAAERRRLENRVWELRSCLQAQQV